MRTFVHHGSSSACDTIPGLGRLSDSLQSCRCTALAALVAASLAESQEHSGASRGFNQESGQVARIRPRLPARKDRHQASSCLLGMQDFSPPISTSFSRPFLASQPFPSQDCVFPFRDLIRSAVGLQVDRRKSTELLGFLLHLCQRRHRA